MKDLLRKIQKSLEINFVDVDFSSKSTSWRDPIPSEPGWYIIETDAPVDVLGKMQKREGTAQYDLKEGIQGSAYLWEKGLAILQQGTEMYVVYSGKSKNLRARAREHFSVYEKTYCLAISQYAPLKKYSWRFRYAPSRVWDESKNEDKTLLFLGEQLWRAKHGWPVLCKG